MVKRLGGGVKLRARPVKLTNGKECLSTKDRVYELNPRKMHTAAEVLDIREKKHCQVHQLETELSEVLIPKQRRFGWIFEMADLILDKYCDLETLLEMVYEWCCCRGCRRGTMKVPTIIDLDPGSRGGCEEVCHLLEIGVSLGDRHNHDSENDVDSKRTENLEREKKGDRVSEKEIVEEPSHQQSVICCCSSSRFGTKPRWSVRYDLGLVFASAQYCHTCGTTLKNSLHLEISHTSRLLFQRSKSGRPISRRRASRRLSVTPSNFGITVL